MGIRNNDGFGLKVTRFKESFDFQDDFIMSKLVFTFLKIIFFKNIILKEQLILLTFLITLSFEAVYVAKMGLIFVENFL